jgi:hypothetical protein
VLRKRACRKLEGLGLAVREGWEVEKGLMNEKGNVYVASVKWVFQVMEEVLV